MIKLIILLLTTALVFSVIGHVSTVKYIKSNYIHVDTLKQRVYNQFGQGDMGEEEIEYLLTGKHIASWEKD